MGYKICPSCGTQNSEDEIVCVNCMADLTEVEPITEPVSDTVEDKTVIISDSITLQGEGFSIVVKSGDVVGRQGVGADSLRSFKTVSRRHAKFYKEGDRWFVEDLGSTNGTFINDKSVPPNQKIEIKDGDVIKLSSQVSLKVKL